MAIADNVTVVTAAEAVAAGASELQEAWLLFCTFLVVSMQLGFAMLEVGSVREAHRMTVLAKNIMDSVVSCIFFSLSSSMGFGVGLVKQGQYAQQLSNWSFCATSVTICSGAMAERTHVVAYLLHAAVMAAMIYPPIADAVWGDGSGFLYPEMHEKFKAGYHYHDCAGSGVVHLVGGLAALAGNSLLGRRIMHSTPDDGGENAWDPEITVSQTPQSRGNGQDLRANDWPRRYDDEVRDQIEFRACNYLQVMGMFTLWVGWYGFNAGSGMSTTTASGHIAAMVAWNTTLAAAAAGVGACLYLYGFHLNLDAGFLCNGVLSGLVSCTASCDVAKPMASVIIGFVSGLVIYPTCSKIMQRMYLDDPVDAVPVHAGSGLFGVLAVAFCVPECNILQSSGSLNDAQMRFCSADHNLGEQLKAQIWGAFTMFWWTLCISFFFWFVMMISERVSAVEMRHIQSAQKLLEAFSVPDKDSKEEADVVNRLAEAARQSGKVRRLLFQHGWLGSNFKPSGPDDLLGLQRKLKEIDIGQIQTSLEPETSCVVRQLVSVASGCCMRNMACFRMRISPAAELSGLGAAKVDGGKIYSTLQNAASQIQELRQAQRTEHSPIKREVHELTLVVRSQEILLNTLTRGRFRAKKRALKSVPEDSKGEIPSDPSDTEGAEKKVSSSSKSSESTMTPTATTIGAVACSSEGPSPSAPSVPLRLPEPQDMQLPPFALPARLPLPIHSDTASTVSDQSFECLSPRSVRSARSTPPPSSYGQLTMPRAPQPPPQGAADVQGMATQLAVFLQAQQQLAQSLTSSGFMPQPAAQHSQPGYAQHSQVQAGSLAQSQLLMAALQAISVNNDGSQDHTPWSNRSFEFNPASTPGGSSITS